jgi:hypothetical protein
MQHSRNNFWSKLLFLAWTKCEVFKNVSFSMAGMVKIIRTACSECVLVKNDRLIMPGYS